MNVKLRLSAFAMLVWALPTVAKASDGPSPVSISGTAALVSDYRFRGISLSDGHVAVQGGLGAAVASGPYAGLWFSTLDGFGELGGSNVELDLYAGYKARIAGATADAGLLYYAYPGSTGGDFEFFEPYASVTKSIGAVTGKAALAFAPAQAALGGKSNIYASGELALAIPGAPVTLKGRLGYSKGDTPLTPSGDYYEWLIGADWAWRALTLGIAYTDTDLSRDQAIAVGATKNTVSPAILFSATASF